MRRRTFLEMTASSVAYGLLAGSVGRLNAAETAATKSLDLKAWTAERRFVAMELGHVAYVERGDAGAAALFLHGFPLNGFQWRGAIERLSGHRRCVAPDFLGLGSSAVAPGASVAAEAQVAMLLSLLDKLAIRSVDVVASDSGGAVAQLLVAHHPERVRSLLLTNCDSEVECPPAALQPVIEMSRAGTFVDQWLVPWLADKTLARSAEGIGGMCYVDPAHPTDEAIECYFSPLTRSPERKARVHDYAIALERNLLAGVGAALKSSTVPVRVAWGTGDTIFSAAGPAHLETAFGNSRGVRRLPGRKLFWPEELPDVIAQEARLLWGVG